MNQLMSLLPVTLRQLVRSVDGVYRDSTFSLVSAHLTKGSLLSVDALISFGTTRYYDGFGSAEFKLTYVRAARLYSETARKISDQKPNMIDVIGSICIACNAADSFDHRLLSAVYGPYRVPIEGLV